MSGFTVRHRTQLAVLLTVAVILLGLRAWSLPIGYDEACYIQGVERKATTGEYAFPIDTKKEQSVPFSPFLTVGPALYVPLTAWQQWTDGGVHGARGPMVLFSGACLLIIVMLGGRLVSPRVGLWAGVLLVGNIQYLTYGAQYVGEVPAMLWILVGLLGQSIYWQSSGTRNVYALILPLSWNLAILTKQYLAAPLGLSLVLLFCYEAAMGRRQYLWLFVIQGLLLPVGSLVEIWLAYGDWDTFVNVWKQRGAYTKEFLSFQWGEPLKFIATKPVLLLGTIALIVRVFILNRLIDRLILILQLMLIGFFLAGEGYERFGTLLLFIPVIYAAEWAVAVLKRIEGSMIPNKKRLWVAVVFILLMTSYLRSPYIFAKGIVDVDRRNESEKAVSDWLARNAVQSTTYIFDMQVLPFLKPGQHFRLPPCVPIGAMVCATADLEGIAYVIEGPHARYFYAGYYDTLALRKVTELGTEPNRYVIWAPTNTPN